MVKNKKNIYISVCVCLVVMFMGVIWYVTKGKSPEDVDADISISNDVDDAEDDIPDDATLKEEEPVITESPTEWEDFKNGTTEILSEPIQSDDSEKQKEQIEPEEQDDGLDARVNVEKNWGTIR